MRNALERIRGNPNALANLFVAALVIGVGTILFFLIRKDNTGIAFAAALIGAGISSGVGLATSVLAQPDLRSVPMSFLEAAKRDVADASYYRKCQLFWITLNENETELVFHYSSTIVPTSNKAIQVKSPEVVDAPAGLEHIETEYSVNGQEPDPERGVVTIEARSSETCTIRYRIAEYITEITDQHTCSASLQNCVIRTDLPEGYEAIVTAVNSRGRETLSYDPSLPARARVFTYAQSLFAGQGFTWKIKKRNRVAD